MNFEQPNFNEQQNDPLGERSKNLAFYELGKKDNSAKRYEFRELVDERHVENVKHLIKAEENILNVKMYDRVARMYGTLYEAGPKIAAAAIENVLVRHCLYLTDDEINSVATHFRNEMKKWVNHTPEGREQERKLLQQNREARNRMINGEVLDEDSANGIRAVVRYVERRREDFSEEKKEKISFYVNDALDAGEKIDLVEIISSEVETENGGVAEKNIVRFVQVKASEHSARAETEKIHKKHKEFAKEKMAHSSELEDSFLKDVSKERWEAAEKLIGDEEQVALAIIGIAVSYSREGDIDKAFHKEFPALSLNANARAYLLSKWSDHLEDVFALARDTTQDEGDSDVRSAIRLMEERIEKYKEKSLIKGEAIDIHEIRSVIETGEKKIFDEKIDLQGAARTISFY